MKELAVLEFSVDRFLHTVEEATSHISDDAESNAKNLRLLRSKLRELKAEISYAEGLTDVNARDILEGIKVRMDSYSNKQEAFTRAINIYTAPFLSDMQRHDPLFTSKLVNMLSVYFLPEYTWSLWNDYTI